MAFDKKKFMATIVFAPTLMIASTVSSASEPVPESVEIQQLDSAKPRNVIFILSDDHRYDAMSFLSHQFAQTPHMDEMARRGVHFRNALVTTSLCSPSRASILTGLYTFRHRVVDNNRAVPEGTLFFPQYLQKAGYATAFIGKWHMGHSSDDPRPGFDHWVSFRGQGHYRAPKPDYTLNVNGQRVPMKGYITDELTDYALDWLKDQSNERPFFLYLSHKAVHANFTPAQRHTGKFVDLPFERPTTESSTTTNVKQPRWLRDQRNSWHGVDFPYHSELNIEQYYKAYCETLCAVDDSIGRVMDQLKQMGVYDETLVIYMSDNGFMFGEHGLIDKRVAYETSIRVPMLMQCPALFTGGMTLDQAVANIDIAPTIMEAMGLAKPPHMDGESFLRLATDEQTDWRDYFLYVYYWERNFPQSPTVFSLRGDQYKLITYHGIWDCDELYNLQQDPEEAHNLIDHPDQEHRVKAMRRQLYDMMRDMGGMSIPLNRPAGGSQNKRLGTRGGDKASDFPEIMVLDGPVHRNAQ